MSLWLDIIYSSNYNGDVGSGEPMSVEPFHYTSFMAYLSETGRPNYLLRVIAFMLLSAFFSTDKMKET